MKGYIYITSAGPILPCGRYVNDPLFTKVPTLGACMPMSGAS